VVNDKKKRRRRTEGFATALACLAALSAVGVAVPLAILSGGLTSPPPSSRFIVPAWVAEVEARLQRRGFEGLTLSYAGRILTANGQAAGRGAAGSAFAAVKAALAAQPEARDGFDILVNNIAVDGEAAVGAAFARLTAVPDVPACQQAFLDTLAGRLVGFEVGSARINADSAELLDALAAVAKRCEAHRIEIAGHTDLSGSPSRNLLLSEDRATAVRDYFMQRGVSVSSLSAAGYGDTRPLAPERTPAADARNRRIEFTVRGL
jgi:outer membrane protein OmpA-like peptidoglycan-associated protein